MSDSSNDDIICTEHVHVTDREYSSPICCFCLKTADPWTSRKTDNDETIYTCDTCETKYKNIVLWDVKYHTGYCIFCDVDDGQYGYCVIKRYTSVLHLCHRCYANYNKLIR